MRRVGAAVVIGVILLSAATAEAGVPARTSRFRVTSPAFRDGATIPDGFTCDGANASVPLRWRGVPKRAVELALIVEDPDTAIGTFVHWVAWGIDPGAHALPEQTVPAAVTQGSNGRGSTGYLGPCPPPGDVPHHYRFTLYALDAPVPLAAGASAADLRAAIRGSVVGRARLVGRYGR